MTTGRLRAIESYNARANELSKELLAKVNGELILEVYRLRAALKWIAEHRHDQHELAGHASEALKEPDPGPPDIVCRRESADDAERRNKVSKYPYWKCGCGQFNDADKIKCLRCGAIMPGNINVAAEEFKWEGSDGT